jgi:hypothetical protein
MGMKVLCTKKRLVLTCIILLLLRQKVTRSSTGKGQNLLVSVRHGSIPVKERIGGLPVVIKD